MRTKGQVGGRDGGRTIGKRERRRRLGDATAMWHHARWAPASAPPPPHSREREAREGEGNGCGGHALAGDGEDEVEGGKAVEYEGCHQEVELREVGQARAEHELLLDRRVALHGAGRGAGGREERENRGREDSSGSADPPAR
eukprot:scaffold120205_cov35-Tisochrysis_lutea.AAC.4